MKVPGRSSQSVSLGTISENKSQHEKAGADFRQTLKQQDKASSAPQPDGNILRNLFAGRRQPKANQVRYLGNGHLPDPVRAAYLKFTPRKQPALPPVNASENIYEQILDDPLPPVINIRC